MQVILSSQILMMLIYYASPYVMIPPLKWNIHIRINGGMFSTLGGVGRDLNSLHDVLKQSYPKIFDGAGWMRL